MARLQTSIIHLTELFLGKAVIRLFNLLIVSSSSCGLLFSWPVAWSENERSYYSLSMVLCSPQTVKRDNGRLKLTQYSGQR